VSGGQEGHDARTLHGIGQFVLVPRTDASALARKDFHVKIDKSPEQTSVFIIDLLNAVLTEETAFLFLKRIFHILS